MENILIFESKFFSIQLNREDQYYLGRLIIFLKRDALNLSELTPEEWVNFGEVVKSCENALTNSFRPTYFNWSCSMNSSYLQDPPIRKLYWHVRPRYNNAFEFNGRIFQDNLFGRHYQTRTKLLLSDEFCMTISKEIIKNLK